MFEGFKYSEEILHSPLRLGTIKVDEWSNVVYIMMPRSNQDGIPLLIPRICSVDKWVSATEERMIALPKVIKYLREFLTTICLGEDEYKLYLIGSLARGQCTPESDIDIGISMIYKGVEGFISPQIYNNLTKIVFDSITPIKVGVHHFAFKPINVHWIELKSKRKSIQKFVAT
jgi:predicted nucleotidyltransferase